MLFTLVQCNSSARRGDAVYGTLLGAVYAMVLLGLIADVCDTWKDVPVGSIYCHLRKSSVLCHFPHSTAPIIAHGFGPEQRHSSVANRARSVLGVCVGSLVVCVERPLASSGFAAVVHHLRDALE